MKNILSVLFVLFCYGASAQEYRPMSEFGTDSIAYLQYNFVFRQNRYIGNYFGDILNDYELPLILRPSRSWEHAPGANGKSWVNGAYIDYNDGRHDDHNKPYGSLYVLFSPPHLPVDETEASMIDYDDSDEWAGILKNCIVKEIGMNLCPFPPRRTDDHRSLNTFEADTIAYLKYNFKDKSYFRKPLIDLLKDYELPLRLFVRRTYPFAPDANGRSWIDGVYIYYPHCDNDKKLSFGVLLVEFKPPYLSYYDVSGSEMNGNNQELAEKLKDCIIGTVDLLIGPFDPKFRH